MVPGTVSTSSAGGGTGRGAAETGVATSTSDGTGRGAAETGVATSTGGGTARGAAETGGAASTGGGTSAGMVSGRSIRRITPSTGGGAPLPPSSPLRSTVITPSTGGAASTGGGAPLPPAASKVPATVRWHITALILHIGHGTSSLTTMSKSSSLTSSQSFQHSEWKTCPHNWAPTS